MKKIKAVFLVLFVLLFSSFSTFAKDVSPLGSITIELEEGGSGTFKEKVGFACTKVADVVDGRFMLRKEYESSKLDLNKIKHSKDLEQAAQVLVKMTNPNEIIFTNKAGIAQFQNLSIGVYLIQVVEKAKYENVAPCLITIPTWDEKEGTMDYQITMHPKHEPWPSDTIEPDKPDSGIKTGDTAPILMLNVAMILSTGCIVWFYQKKKRQKR